VSAPAADQVLEVRATRAYLAGFGTSGSLLAGAVLMFLLASALVAFRGWPEVAAQSPVVNVAAPHLRVSGSSRASRILQAALAGAGHGAAATSAAAAGGGAAGQAAGGGGSGVGDGRGSGGPAAGGGGTTVAQQPPPCTSSGCPANQTTLFNQLLAGASSTVKSVTQTTTGKLGTVTQTVAGVIKKLGATGTATATTTQAAVPQAVKRLVTP
jgi:hypothetical protein